MNITVTEDNYQKRLDLFIRHAVKELPRSGMFSAMRKGRIKVNGKTVKDSGFRLSPGDEVEIVGFKHTEVTAARIIPKRMVFPVLFEDEYLLVISKPRGLAVHPGKGERGSTVLSGLEYYGRAGGFVPFLTHRLDKYTSGVLVVAKSESMARKVGDMFRRKADSELRKFYWTLVFGRAQEEASLSRPLDGKKALTRYKRLSIRTWNGTTISLLDVELVTGRKHQIRRHLAQEGLPVAGDDEYGIWDLNKAFQRDFGVKEYLLHCREIRMRHPHTGAPLILQAEFPKEMNRIFEG